MKFCHKYIVVSALVCSINWALVKCSIQYEDKHSLHYLEPSEKLVSKWVCISSLRGELERDVW